MKNVRVAGAVFATPSEKVQRIANASKLPTEPIETLIEKNEIVEADKKEDKSSTQSWKEKILSQKKKKG